MNHFVTAIVAGAFLCAFGAGAVWFLNARYPRARFLRFGYGLMSLGGALFALWGISRTLTIGVTAAALVAIGAVAGTVGVLRKEVPLPTR